MTSGINFWDNSVWGFVVILAVLLGSMLIANALRRMIKALRKTLIPSSVLAGFLVLIVGGVWKKVTGSDMLDKNTLEELTYHGLGLGFVALALRSMEKQKGKKARQDIFSTSVVVVNTYLLQGFTGLAITIVLYYIMNSFFASGALLPMGYGQGPGQAYNWGHNFEALGFENGASFGLTVAACGFIAASVGGVIYLAHLRKTGRVRIIENAEEIERITAETYQKPGEIPLSESVDKLTVQFALVFIAYGISYLIMYIVHSLCSGIPFYDNTVCSLMWGFNFLLGTAVAILIKNGLAYLRRKGLVKRAYTNDFMLNRISGAMFDIMVVASIAAINLDAFKNRAFWLPLLLICVIGSIVTFIYVKAVSKRLFPDYVNEAFLSLYGMLTGTASTGVILLREIDPTFDTPASSNLIFQSLWAILLGFPMLLMMGYVGQSPKLALICFGLMIVLFIGMNLLMLRKQIFGKKENKK